jgi:hypothetical protein
MSEIEFADKLKFELASLGLSTDENLEMVGKCHLELKVFGNPYVDTGGSVVFGFPSDRKRYLAPLKPDDVALRIYDYLFKYKMLELGKQPVGHVPVAGITGKRKCNQGHETLQPGCTSCDLIKRNDELGYWGSRKTYSTPPKAKQGGNGARVIVAEPPRRVFNMMPSAVAVDAKQIAEMQLEDFKAGTWVISARGELKLAEDLEITDLPLDQINKLRALSRKLREVEARI